MKKKHLSRIISAALVMIMAASSQVTTAAESSIVDLSTLKVTQTLTTNEGTTLNQVYSYTASSATPGAPALKAASISIQMGEHDLQKIGTGALTFGTFPHAGEYDYTLTQNALNPAVGKGYLSGDSNSYLLKVMVANTASGPAVKEVYAVNNSSGVKVSGDGIAFVSSYVRPGGAASPDMHALVIANAVSGEFADRTRPFSVSVKFSAPATNTMADGSPYDPSKFSVRKSTGAAIAVDAAGMASFTLADGESAVFDNIPAGTSYIMRQKIEQGYAASMLITENGHDTALSSQPEAATLTASNLNVTEGVNRISLTNTLQSIEMTGVTLDWIPFAAMLLLACAAVLLYERIRHHEAG